MEHSSCLGIRFAIAAGFIIPGIYLLRPLALTLWVSISGVSILLSILILLHHLRFTSERMDVQIPPGVLSAIEISLFVIQISMLILGIGGWVRHIRIRNANHINSS